MLFCLCNRNIIFPMRVFILIFALLTLLSYASDNNVNLIELSYTNCLIEVQYAPSSTNNFTMVNCYDFKTDPTYVTSIWKECTDYCCDPNINYAQSRESLDSCDSDRKAYYQTTPAFYLPIIFYCLAGVFFIIALTCLYRAQ
jgi:hypothetical protein